MNKHLFIIILILTLFSKFICAQVNFVNTQWDAWNKIFDSVPGESYMNMAMDSSNKLCVVYQSSYLTSKSFRQSASAVVSDQGWAKPNSYKIAISHEGRIATIRRTTNILYIDIKNGLDTSTTLIEEDIPGYTTFVQFGDLVANQNGDFLLTIAFEDTPNWWNQRYQLLRILKTGGIDSSFGVNGRVEYAAGEYAAMFFYNLGVMPSRATRGDFPIAQDIYGNIYLGCKNANYTGGILRFNPNGVYDSVFNQTASQLQTNLTRTPFRIRLDYQGKIYAMCRGDYYGKTNSKLYSWNQDGTKNTNFDTSVTTLDKGLFDFFVLPDNRLLGAQYYYVEPFPYFDEKTAFKTSIINSSLNMLSGYTKSCASLLVKGTPLDVLFKDSTVYMGYQFLSCYPTVFSEGGSGIYGMQVNPCPQNATSANLQGITSIPTNAVCPNEAVQLIVQGNLNNASNWVYHTNLNTIDQPIYGDSIVVYPQQTTTYYFRAVGLCNNNVTEDSITIQVNALTATVNMAICANQTPYVWNGQNLTSSGTYTYQTQNSSGCDSIFILNLTVHPNTTSSSSLSICSNQTPYVWNGQSLSSSGTYTYQTQNSNGCDSMVTLNLTVHNLPNPIIYPSGINLATSPYYVSYQWYLNGNAIPGATDSLHLPIVNGLYEVQVTDSNGCSNNSAPYSFISVSTIDFNSTEGMYIYPNPTSGILHIAHSAGSTRKNLFNTLGQLILTTDSNEMDLSALAAGLYYLRYEDKVWKVVKE